MSYALILGTHDCAGAGPVFAAAIKQADLAGPVPFTPKLIAPAYSTFPGLVDAVLAAYPPATWGGCREVLVPVKSLALAQDPLTSWATVQPHTFVMLARYVSRLFQCPLTRYHVCGSFKRKTWPLGTDQNLVAADLAGQALEVYRRAEHSFTDMPGEDDRLARCLPLRICDEDTGECLDPYTPEHLAIIAQANFEAKQEQALHKMRADALMARTGSRSKRRRA